MSLAGAAIVLALVIELRVHGGVSKDDWLRDAPGDSRAVTHLDAANLRPAVYDPAASSSRKRGEEIENRKSSIVNQKSPWDLIFLKNKDVIPDSVLKKYFRFVVHHLDIDRRFGQVTPVKIVVVSVHCVSRDCSSCG